jgi:hypothetical protein
MMGKPKKEDQTTSTQQDSEQSEKGYLVETDPVQDQHDLDMMMSQVKPAPLAELEAFLETKSEETLPPALDEGEIRELQKRFPTLSREKALEMARAFGA